MRKIKWIIPFFIAIIVLIGCSPEEVRELEEEPKSSEELKEEATESAKVEVFEQTEQVHHIHGLTFNPVNDEQLFIATHHGVVLYDLPTKEAFYVGESRDDFMGFKFVGSTSSLMSSGHPGIGSDLPDPLGFMWSEDFGQTWDIRSLLGEYDFHALTASFQNDQHIYGYALDYKSGSHDGLILRSLDQGYSFEKVEVNGLHLADHGVLDLAFSPESEDVIYAATIKGLMKSVDGGVNFEVIHESIVTAIKVIDNDTVLFYDENEKHLVFMEQDQIKTILVEANQVPVNYISLKDKNSLDTIVISTMDSSLYMSTNNGQDWEALIRSGTID